MNRLRFLPLFAALASPLACTSTWAQGTAPAAELQPQQAVGELDCRTLLRLSGQERDFAILYLQGFVSGRLNQQLLPVNELAQATDRLIDQCIDKPSGKVLALLEQIRSVRK